MFARMRADSSWWKDHVIPDVEQVVAETERFAVVEKREGTAAVVAEESDPRD